jgi:arylsulfatase A-like enzyme
VPHLELGKPGEYLTDRLTDEALKVIDAAGDRPFFLYLAHHAVHTPIEAKPGDVKDATHLLSKTAPPRNATYAAMVRNLDENVGRVLAHLQKRGLAERTIVLFFSDNGGYNGVYRQQQVTDNAPLRSGKGSLYEGGVRVPLIISWPGVTPHGAECREPVLSTDLFYTMLAMAGLSQPDPSCGDGLSLAGLLASPQTHLARDALFFHYPHYYSSTSPVSAIRAGDWKLLEYYEDDRVELYNLREDLGETTDLAARMSDQVRRLQDRLHGWLAAVGAQFPATNPGFKPKPPAKPRAR